MFIMLGAAILVLIWLLIFTYGLIFRPRRLPYLIYLIFSIVGLHLLWRLYFVHDHLLLTILISLSILLSTFFGLFGLLGNGIEDLENPAGKGAPAKIERRLLAMACILLGMFTLGSYFIIDDTKPPINNKDWTKVAENIYGNIHYVDLNNIRKVDGFISYWELIDYAKPTEFGHLSSIINNYADCKKYTFKFKDAFYYKKAMAKGKADLSHPYNELSNKWQNTPIGSVFRESIKKVCNYSK